MPYWKVPVQIPERSIPFPSFQGRGFINNHPLTSPFGCSLVSCGDPRSSPSHLSTVPRPLYAFSFNESLLSRPRLLFSSSFFFLKMPLFLSPLFIDAVPTFSKIRLPWVWALVEQPHALCSTPQKLIFFHYFPQPSLKIKDVFDFSYCRLRIPLSFSFPSLKG